MKVGVVLGSGLGAFAEALEDRKETAYAQIAGWPRSTAIGHAGKLVEGRIGSTEVLVMAGRAHLYEGYNAQQITFGIRELKRRGAGALILTNAAGGINLSLKPGQLVLISDHINLMGANPLIGPNDDAEGPRFPDMTDAYDGELRRIATEEAARTGIELHEGVYAAMLGPSYETPAEIRFLRTIGADLVGMSTVPEVIAARHMNLSVLAISCVTNMAAGISSGKINHDEVLETGERVRTKFLTLLRAILPRINTYLGSARS